ncbi:MAG: TolC family protein [Fimbriimonadaceae bacterium]|nr:TolC family protein [Fimbriimonadaceae bacterium]
MRRSGGQYGLLLALLAVAAGQAAEELGPPRPAVEMAVAADAPAPAAVAAGAAGPTTAGADEVLTLLDCVAAALLQNPELGASREAVAKAAGNRRAATGATLPDLSFSYNEIWQQQNKVNIGGPAAVTVAPGNMRQFALNSTWVVWAGGALQANQAITRLAEAAARHQVRATANGVIAQVVSAYLNLLRAQELLGVAERTVELAQQQVKVATDSFEAGAMPKVNVLRATAAYQNALQAQLQAANGIALAQASLNAAMGRSQLQPLRIAALPRQLADPPDLLASLRQAVQQRPELRAMQKAIDINEEAVKAARAGYYPSVSVNSKVERTMGVGQFGSADSFQVVGVFRLNLWDWYQTSGQVKAAQADVAAERQRLEGLMQQIELQVRRAVLNIGAARQRVEAAQAEVDAARQALQIEDLRYKEGDGTYLELLDARRAVTEAEANLVTAYYDNALGESDWLAATGGFLGSGAAEVTLPQAQTLPLPADPPRGGTTYDELLQQYGVTPAQPAPAAGK